MLNPGSETSLGVGRRQFCVQVTPTGPPHALSVTIVDGESTWTFDQPGWRPLELGTGPLGAFLWSAREVIVLPSQIDEAPTVAVAVDEDLLAVFSDPDGWTLVRLPRTAPRPAGNHADRSPATDAHRVLEWRVGRRLA